MSNRSQSLIKEREAITARIYYEKYKTKNPTASELLKDVNTEMNRLYGDTYKNCSLSTIKRFLSTVKNKDNSELYEHRMNDLLIGTAISNYDVFDPFIIKASYEKAPLISNLLMDRFFNQIIVTVSYDILVIYILKNEAIKDESAAKKIKEMILQLFKLT